ncbi:receptor expression-enhancing protein 6-like isoform X1 [Scyliorhinus canicula]|uniref:receptor expression-enhancing protein 6-like isoform X1 n=1 Tax=Scyliorhinus canicula TaxID=7830 RepID=UPI0018F61C5A|nr:receptor expression-enhancing protein 6-like isoform X1 [Scyliorhinus canicula]
MSLSRFFQVLIALNVLCIVLGYGELLFPWINVIIFLYPAYFSILAIESDNKEDKLKWLMFWVIYGAFAIFECAARILLFVFPAFPVYHKFKSLFMLWCMAPVDWNGSHAIYMNIVRPFFYKHKPMVDDLEERITEVLDNVRMEVHPTPEPEIKSPSRLKTSKMAISKIFKRAKHK